MDARLLMLAIKAQKHAQASTRLDDGESTAMRFCVQDMLDILGAEIDAARATETEKE